MSRRDREQRDRTGNLDNILTNMLDMLTIEINSNLRDLSATQDLNQKKIKAEIVHLLCQSLGTFLQWAMSATEDGLEDMSDIE